MLESLLALFACNVGHMLDPRPQLEVQSRDQSIVYHPWKMFVFVVAGPWSLLTDRETGSVARDVISANTAIPTVARSLFQFWSPCDTRGDNLLPLPRPK